MTIINSNTKPAIDFRTDRDATLKLIDWFDINRVKAARILVAGAGATGNEALKNLALIGIGNIYIIDRDTIELSNLSRSVLYRALDNGLPKASTAARAVREINPDVRVRWQVGDITFDLGLGLLRRMDVVIGCLDNRDARLYLNRACWAVNRPWIDAGIGQLNGQVRVFRPGHGACYECSFTQQDYKQIVVPCNRLVSMYEAQRKIPTTPTIASIMAAVQVQEALKLLDTERWTGRTLESREFIFNGTVGEASVMGLVEREGCPAHSTIDENLIVELSDARTQETTVSQFLEMARKELGPSAFLVLKFELAVEMCCSHCRTSTRLLCPVRKLFLEQLKCETCGNERHLVTTHELGHSNEKFQEDILDLTLTEIGVPPLDILEVHTPDGHLRYFELTGDVREALNFQAQSLSEEDEPCQK